MTQTQRKSPSKTNLPHEILLTESNSKTDDPSINTSVNLESLENQVALDKDDIDESDYASDEESCSDSEQVLKAISTEPQARNIQDLLTDEDLDSGEESSDDQTADSISATPTPWQIPGVVKNDNQRSKFIETEAEVEEDEFMNYGGIDGEDSGGNEYDKKMLNDKNDEYLDLDAIMKLHHHTIAENDKKAVDALINDVTSGAYRKRRGAGNFGNGLDLYDSDEEAEAILNRIRQRMGFVGTKKKDEDVTTLAYLASNPKTQAFAKCFEIPDVKEGVFSSSDDDTISKESLKKIEYDLLDKSNSKYSTLNLDNDPESLDQVTEDVSREFVDSIFDKIKSRKNDKVAIFSNQKNTKEQSSRLLTKRSFLQMNQSVNNRPNQGPSKTFSAFKVNINVIDFLF
jgi:hypothetical protein